MNSSEEKTRSERRSGLERRHEERRIGDRFAADGWRLVGGVNRRHEGDRRSGFDRRRPSPSSD
jgi:hypothetical protein